MQWITYMRKRRMQWADMMSKRKTYLMAYQPVCDNMRCMSGNVVLVDPYDTPAQWQCQDCGLYFPYEPDGTDGDDNAEIYRHGGYKI